MFIYWKSVGRTVWATRSGRQFGIGDNHGTSHEVCLENFCVRFDQLAGTNTARHLSMHAVRGEQRRREREPIAVTMQTLEATADADRIADELEPAMAELDPVERDVPVLRFLEDRSLREVGVLRERPVSR